MARRDSVALQCERGERSPCASLERAFALDLLSRFPLDQLSMRIVRIEPLLQPIGRTADEVDRSVYGGLRDLRLVAIWDAHVAASTFTGRQGGSRHFAVARIMPLPDVL